MQIQLRGLGIRPTPAIEQHMERRLSFALGRLAERLQDLTVRFKDLNGPRGGEDMSCRMVARLRSGGTVRVEEQHSDLYSAIDLAAGRIGRAIRRKMDRRRSLLRSGMLQVARRTA